MRIVFDLKNFKTKLILSITILFAFYILNLTIPDSEFNNISQNYYYDRLYYTVSNHTGLNGINNLQPNSTRAKTMSTLHILLSFSLLLI